MVLWTNTTKLKSSCLALEEVFPGPQLKGSWMSLERLWM